MYKHFLSVDWATRGFSATDELIVLFATKPTSLWIDSVAISAVVVTKALHFDPAHSFSFVSRPEGVLRGCAQLLQVHVLSTLTSFTSVSLWLTPRMSRCVAIFVCRSLSAIRCLLSWSCLCLSGLSLYHLSISFAIFLVFSFYIAMHCCSW